MNNKLPILRLLPAFDLSFNATGGAAVSNDGASGRPANFRTNLRWVRVVATADCRIAVHAAATATSTLLPAGVVEYFEVVGCPYISVVGDSVAGKLNVTPVT